MGLEISVYVSFRCKLSLLSLYMQNRSREFICGPLFMKCRMLSVFSKVPYTCPVSRICCAYLDVGLLECIACMCSLYRVLKFRPVCPMYFNWQLLH
jgi:hypothetical protein